MQEFQCRKSKGKTRPLGGRDFTRAPEQHATLHRGFTNQVGMIVLPESRGPSYFTTQGKNSVKTWAMQEIQCRKSKGKTCPLGGRDFTRAPEQHATLHRGFTSQVCMIVLPESRAVPYTKHYWHKQFCQFDNFVCEFTNSDLYMIH